MGRTIWPAAFLAGLTLLNACSDDPAIGTAPPAPDVVLRVVMGGDVAADWTLAALEDQIPFSEATIDGDAQRGPSLVGVLAASGVGDWESGEVIGMGEGRVFEVGLDISASEVNEGWILDVTKQGTLKLASADLPREQWVRDVGEINLP